MKRLLSWHPEQTNTGSWTRSSCHLQDQNTDFRQKDRISSFLEVERVLRTNGLFLFACEVPDFEPRQERQFLDSTQRDPDISQRNCQIYDSIDLIEICSVLSSLKICQSDMSRLPDGRPLRHLVSPSEASCFTGKSGFGMAVTWGSFFVVFRKVRSA